MDEELDDGFHCAVCGGIVNCAEVKREGGWAQYLCQCMTCGETYEATEVSDDSQR